jgi:hypothetical protein
MSRIRHDSSDSQAIEPATVTNWRVVGAAVTVGLTFLAIPVVLRPPVGPDRRANPGPLTIQSVPHADLTAAQPTVVMSRATAPQFSFPPLEPYAVRKTPQPAVVVCAPVSTASIRATPTNPKPAEIEPSAEADVSASVAPPGFRRRAVRGASLEHELVEVLQASVPVVSLDTEPGTSKALASRATEEHPLLALLPRRPDLAGLPARQASECQANEQAAGTLTTVSYEARPWRSRLAQPGGDASHYQIAAQANNIEASLERQAGCKHESAVVGLEQILQAELPAFREVLVKHLSKIPGPVAGAALARRAVFDLSGRVRESAVEAMRSRPREDVRPTLVAALRYPWPPAADHAAEAIVNLGDVDAVAALVKLLDLPDPLEPTCDAATGNWTVRELVCVNHLGNCLLCHAASTGKDDPLRAPVPEPGKRLPLIYYSPKGGPTVRADITYLRQDFSVTQRVEKSSPWPEYQRFDYMVRRRLLSESEVVSILSTERTEDYSQRGAVLFALRELTGSDAGVHASDWSRLLQRR